MSEVINPGNTMETIPLEDLLEEVLKRKHQGMRFDQACAAFVDGKFELSYSFSDDDAYSFDTLRVVVDDLARQIPSVSVIYPCASFYENEMRELFGCQIEMIGFDYKDKLYRLNVETPMLPEAGKAALKEALAAATEKSAPGSTVDAADVEVETDEGGAQ